jgi:PTH2 family peptidyl-tRNA hydrolase
MYKQAIVVRSDLKLSKGKTAAQAAHASLEAYKKAGSKERDSWEKEGSKKVVLKVESESELLKAFNLAKELHLPCSLIKDAGRTEVEPGTATAVGIGPAQEKEIDKVTGKLKML